MFCRRTCPCTPKSEEHMTDVQCRTTRLLIVDDHAMFREGIASLLNREPDFEVVGKCASAREAFQALASAEPDVILLDFDLGPEPAADFAREVKASGFTGFILVVTAGV